MITKRKRPQKIWVDKGKEFAGEFKKFCDREGIQIYSTMSETKAAFAERAIRSLKMLCIATLKTMDTSIFTSCLNLLQR